MFCSLSNGYGIDTSVGGFAISDIGYTFAADASKLASVEFTTSPAATQAFVKLVSTGNWYECTYDDGSDWSCPTADLLVADVDEFAVSAADLPTIP